jgi:hypothetical protein
MKEASDRKAEIRTQKFEKTGQNSNQGGTGESEETERAVMAVNTRDLDQVLPDSAAKS